MYEGGLKGGFEGLRVGEEGKEERFGCELFKGGGDKKKRVRGSKGCVGGEMGEG